MKLITLDLGGTTVAARVDGDSYVEITGHRDVGSLLAHEEWRSIAAAADGARHAAGGVRRAMLGASPSKIMCVGLNYRGHIEEMGRELPEYPTVFAKFPDTLCGPDDPVIAVKDDPALDWEGELVVVIGKTVYREGEAAAAAAIAGYTIANDISMRSWQYRSQEWLQGKIWARSTPVGPVLVTPDEFDTSTAVLRTTVNGEVMQSHAVADLLFSPARLVSYLSTMVPLRPGDLILTGTPGGVGRAMTPPRYLTAGDTVEVSIDGIGSLRNEVVAESPQHVADLRRVLLRV
ncbi:fumarylacetoacetate hydrolase family protein [Gordonia sp. zg691]|uniref:Fumarylacetoacetate hydrolase family protein n=1 Tax=Gordonia jinghuaiqii TaxID=2758710 RepID=A0A7D7R487_9ACTN|nr:fumarylacetoacetate hydrolase family protein [Gordonia jinghuaiqii]MBD0862303.1 fumarylacetoacetate hydrolase family protein [Gordonia jinghuaiqii]MCR5978473.1 FAA hydrolase family protein [Gordonia jinghuaiqii]QMT02807.1 fumarylacetoacetate hydrolase family protein [Gordonia jinghuaiqii]